MRACLITNPRSGRGGVDLSEASLVLEAQGWEVAVRQKLYGGHATELAREAAGDGYDLVCGCGGDGTLSEIVDGLVHTSVAIGVLPGGTVNLWAHELGVSGQLRVAAMQLVHSEPLPVDVGHLHINGKHQQHFLLMAGLGLDGAVIGRVSKPLKNRIGPLAVGLAALETLPGFRAVPIKAELDGACWQGRVAQVVIGNTRRYAGFTRMTGGAYINDGLFDVCFITASNPLAAGRQLGSLLVRQRPSASSAETYRVKNITIHSPVALPLQVDGGSVEHPDDQPGTDGIEYRFSVVPHAVRMMVPRTYDGELFELAPLEEAPLHSGKSGKKGKKHKNGKGKKNGG